MSELKGGAAKAHFDATAAKYEAMTGGTTRAVAQHLLSLPQLSGLLTDSDAVLHDNASGTCIVSDEVLQRNPAVKIHATDVSETMLKYGEDRFGHIAGFESAVMPAEKLDFGDGTFTHSITNLGLLFFNDKAAGAREIYRTLRPGGVAVVTSWSYLGYLEDIIVPAQRVVRPDTTPFQVPVPQEWFTAERVSQCLREDGGFDDVQVLSHRVMYSTPNREEFVKLIVGSFKGLFWSGWPEDDQRRLEEQLVKQVEDTTKNSILPDGRPGVGVPMEAIIAVCRK